MLSTANSGEHRGWRQCRELNMQPCRRWRRQVLGVAKFTFHCFADRPPLSPSCCNHTTCPFQLRLLSHLLIVARPAPSSRSRAAVRPQECTTRPRLYCFLQQTVRLARGPRDLVSSQTLCIQRSWCRRRLISRGEKQSEHDSTHAMGSRPVGGTRIDSRRMKEGWQQPMEAGVDIWQCGPLQALEAITSPSSGNRSDMSLRGRQLVATSPRLPRAIQTKYRSSSLLA
jgi:hypothetical protein